MVPRLHLFSARRGAQGTRAQGAQRDDRLHRQRSVAWRGAQICCVGHAQRRPAGRRRDSAAVAPQTLHQAASPLQRPVDGLSDSHHDAHLPRQLAECRAGHAPAHPDRVDRACAGNGIAVLFAIELLHEKRKTLTELTDRLPVAARGTLYLLAILAIAVFGVWGAGYSAQAFIYFQF